MLKKIINKENKLPFIILLAIVSFISFNVLNKNFFKNLRFDLTRSNVYTLSSGTKSILESILKFEILIGVINDVVMLAVSTSTIFKVTVASSSLLLN